MNKLPALPDTQEIRTVIPARDEETHISRVVSGCLQWTPHVLVVCDHCQDQTGERARVAGARVIENDGVPGKGAALRAGWRYWQEEPDWNLIVVLDGDGQHDPAEIPDLVEASRSSGRDLIIGSRAPFAPPMPRIRRWTNRFMSLLTSRMTGTEVTDSQSGFRVLRRKLIETVDWRGNTFDLETEMITAAVKRGGVGFRPIGCYYRHETSTIQPLRDTLIWIRIMVICLEQKRKPSH